MGIYTESKISGWAGFLILAVAFLALYLPALLAPRELFRTEGLYAAAAREVHFGSMTVTVHHAVSRSVYPLCPMLAAGVTRLTGMSMETALRGLSILMLAASSVVVYLAAASERSCRAGWVASAMFFSCAIALEKGCEGFPTTTAAFFLLTAQLLFFNFGVRRVNWNLAWLLSALLLSAAFFAGGFPVMVFFTAPLFFLRRPLSVKSKFRKPGFAGALAVMALTFLLWGAPLYSAARQLPLLDFDWSRFTWGSYLAEIALFPLYLPIRLLPWSLIAWLPFCVALQSIDSTPIFSRYLRTLCFVSLALLWLLPATDPRELFFMLGPLSILVGINYDLGVRRYGGKFRRVLKLGGIFAVVVAVLVAGAYFLPVNLLNLFFSLSKSLEFREASGYGLVAVVAVAATGVIALLIHGGRTSLPVWLLLLLISLSGGIFYGSVLLPYQAQEHEKRVLGEDIRIALAGAGGARVYKIDISDLYGGLFYSGAEVVRIMSLDELPEDEPVVYLISTEFPQRADRSWTNLLPADYTYCGRKLALWRGVLRPVE